MITVQITFRDKLEGVNVTGCRFIVHVHKLSCFYSYGLWPPVNPATWARYLVGTVWVLRNDMIMESLRIHGMQTDKNITFEN